MYSCLNRCVTSRTLINACRPGDDLIVYCIHIWSHFFGPGVIMNIIKCEELVVSIVHGKPQWCYPKVSGILVFIPVRNNSPYAFCPDCNLWFQWSPTDLISLVSNHCLYLPENELGWCWYICLFIGEVLMACWDLTPLLWVRIKNLCILSSLIYLIRVTTKINLSLSLSSRFVLTFL